MTFVSPSAASTADIVDVAICGNTAMHHLLLGLPVRQLGRAPFVAAVRDAMDVKARDLDLTACPGAYVHMAPNIGGFVGSDHVTALLATQELWQGSATTLVMDIGTNTEISLIHRGDILSASCPSGPALEGGHISCGMRAAEGAIERVSVADGRIAIGVIGNRQPVGLCGSGVIDAIAALRQAGVLNDGGRIVGASRRHRRGRRQARSGAGARRHFHPARRARGAARQGGDPHRHRAAAARPRPAEGDIGLVVIAGAFGAYIDVGSAIAIGLLAGAAARSLQTGRQCRRRRRAADSRLTAERARKRANLPSAAAMSSSARAAISRRLSCTTSASSNGERRDEFAWFRNRHDRRSDQSRFQEHQSCSWIMKT